MDVVPLDKPFTVLFDPSSICNFRCVQCFQSVRDSSRLMDRGIMKFDDFKKVIDDLAQWPGPKIKVVRIIGFGEPFVNKEYDKMLKYIKEAGVSERVETTSNCSLLTPELSKKLVEYGLDYLRVSIYSAIQEKHKIITNSNIDVQTIYNNLLLLKNIKAENSSIRPFVYVKMLDAFDDGENAAFFEKYRDVADEILIEKPHNWLDMDNKDFIGDLYKDRKEEVVNKINFEATMKKACPQPFKMVSIRFNGDVIVCDPDWLNNTKVGNAFEQSIEAIWNGDAMFQFRKMQLENRRHENASCRVCNTFLTDNYTVDSIDGFPVEKLRRNKK